jgi:hypothetical protein
MLFVPPTVPGTLDDRKRLRPIGRNNERYQQMLDDLRKLAVFADEAGVHTGKRLAGKLHEPFERADGGRAKAPPPPTLQLRSRRTTRSHPRRRRWSQGRRPGQGGPAKHVPGTGPGKRVTGAGPHTASSKAEIPERRG